MNREFETVKNLLDKYIKCGCSLHETVLYLSSSEENKRIINEILKNEIYKKVRIK